MKKTIKKPPCTLSRESKAYWKKLIQAYSLDDEPGLLLLKTTLESYDRINAARCAIEKEGMQIVDRFGQVRPHPLLTVERDARSQFMLGMKSLNFDLEPLRDGPGRPPGVR
jgi:phage terminase small subunit